MIIFWAKITSSTGISTPMSPRATMMPSDASRISSKLFRPSRFSILEMIWMFSPPWAFRCSRSSTTSERLRMKEAATKSTPCSQPKIRSCLSFLSQRRQGDGDARQVNAFVLAEVAIVQHFTDNFVAFDSRDFHTDQAIVHRDGVADGEVGGEAFIGYRNDFVVADDGFIGSEGEGLACFQGDVVAAFQLDGTNFRPLVSSRIAAFLPVLLITLRRFWMR